jgi:RNA polymerase sigma factor (TIGR02999 family)
MTDVTQILSAIQQGDPHAAEQLLPLVYEELRQLAAQKLAREKPGQTLQATAPVHEDYLRLVDTDQAQHWNSHRHFFAAAAEAMRRILVKQARRKQADKRGGGRQLVPLDDAEVGYTPAEDEVLIMDEALTASRRGTASRPTHPAALLRRSVGRSRRRVGRHLTLQGRRALGFCLRKENLVPLRQRSERSPQARSRPVG